jgi:hypothetical protein
MISRLEILTKAKSLIIKRPMYACVNFFFSYASINYFLTPDIGNNFYKIFFFFYKIFQKNILVDFMKKFFFFFQRVPPYDFLFDLVQIYFSHYRFIKLLRKKFKNVTIKLINLNKSNE